MTQPLKKNPTAGILIIGNEILSGRTQDVNAQFIAQRLLKLGIKLDHVAVVPDVETKIIDAVLWMSQAFNYVFTTGGIGPTHDDITALAMAKAFKTPLERHPLAYDLLLGHYGQDNLTPAREKMAFVPKGATLIENKATVAPGFQIKNVYVMAGVPKIMQSMFLALEDTLETSHPFVSGTVHCYMPESILAQGFEDIQKIHPDLEMGSYPFFDPQKGHGTSLVVKGIDQNEINLVIRKIEGLITELGGVPLTDADRGKAPTISPEKY